MSTLLKLEDITMQFGGVVAVNNLSLEVGEGEIVSLIGPNGAGKTTAFNVATGVYEPTNGRVSFAGKTIVESHPRGKMNKLYAGENKGVYKRRMVKTPDRITALGIARTFQNIRLFKSMTVFENVLTAKHLRRRSNIFTATLHLNFREEAQMRFIADDAREFARRFPEADLAGRDASESFRRFCGSRYGREPLSELYADYLEVAGGALRAAQARGASRAARSTGSGGSGSYEALTARQQSELDAWNRAFPQMKMSAREYLSRNK